MNLPIDKISNVIMVILLLGCSKNSEEFTTTDSVVSSEFVYEASTPCKQLDEIDLRMLNIIKQIEQEYQHDEIFLFAFNDAQIFWTQYRNRQVKAVFPLPPKKYDYPVGECKCEIYRDLTELRVKELQKWIDGVPSDITCTGSYKLIN